MSESDESNDRSLDSWAGVIQRIGEDSRRKEEEALDEFLAQVEQGDERAVKIHKIAQNIAPERWAEKPFEQQSKGAQYKLVYDAANMLETYERVKDVLENA